jgi:hypothetical protein
MEVMSGNPENAVEMAENPEQLSPRKVTTVMDLH